MGPEDYDEEFDDLSAGLKELGIEWSAPPVREHLTGRATHTSFGYSTVHFLRRAYALTKAGRPVTPVFTIPDMEQDSHVVADEAEMFESHLLCHSDADGYYVPVDFETPEVVDEQFVGSSQRLLAELRFCAEPLGIRLAEDGTLSDAEADRINALDTPYQSEWQAWIALHEACLLSITSGHAIIFN
nr:SCH10.02, hypothetical protein, len: 221 aa; unknown function, probable CDS suggested by positional base preference, GC frame analysis and amino acid composition [Kibdelosporangium sp. MJ126-NF4]CTQ95037.1 SCH10.02, hypothetical protein, len: 221 aa; unknown function, probable CDS suggested by positional base preference, GC frame analysis and amino acid composition [Kibdelosporangium sp. MJ126-NF4]